ncbi:hypothetical protein B0A50_00527 [Salinomyces thailandicus]|uniref:Uncharacterized protein n=1 Tax=Salinomyces thailandicus TaxID=706561 RepID=A0A4U0UDT9_9PEZI|nr:hypothetical protein B0A50_00527 [Salinomyces thailandica]
MASSTPANVKMERRSSIGRALEKLKAAMKRRTSSSKTLPTVSTSSNTQEPLAKTEEIEDPKVTTRGDSDATKTVGIAPIEVLDSAPLLTSDKHLVEVDDNDDDEALLPMPTNTSGITDEKARLLLQKPKKSTKERDPAVFQAVDERLAQGFPERRPEIAAAD